MAALPLIVFDVNETLLDLQTMEPTFERVFGEKGAMRLWFANLIMYSVVANSSRAVRSIHRYRFRCDEDVGGHARR